VPGRRITEMVGSRRQWLHTHSSTCTNCLMPLQCGGGEERHEGGRGACGRAGRCSPVAS
jgi:hypothetical protein